MSDVFTAAGSAVYVSAASPATEDEAGYDAITWTLVGGVTAIPDLGDVYNVVNHDPLNGRRTIKKKGQINGGSGSLDMARITGDAGQDILLTALGSDCDISMRIDHNDVPCSGGATPTQEFRKILVISKTSTGLGGPDNIDALSFGIEVNSATVTVAAA